LIEKLTNPSLARHDLELDVDFLELLHLCQAGLHFAQLSSQALCLGKELFSLFLAPRGTAGVRSCRVCCRLHPLFGFLRQLVEARCCHNTPP